MRIDSSTLGERQIAYWSARFVDTAANPDRYTREETQELIDWMLRAYTPELGIPGVDPALWADKPITFRGMPGWAADLPTIELPLGGTL